MTREIFSTEQEEDDYVANLVNELVAKKLKEAQSVRPIKSPYCHFCNSVLAEYFSVKFQKMVCTVCDERELNKV